MNEDELRVYIRAVLREEQEAMAEKLDSNTLKTIAAILTGFGIDEDEKKEVKEDFRYLRKWRKGTEKVSGVGLTALVTLMVGGILSALVIGIKMMLGKP